MAILKDTTVNGTMNIKNGAGNPVIIEGGLKVLGDISTSGEIQIKDGILPGSLALYEKETDAYFPLTCKDISLKAEYPGVEESTYAKIITKDGLKHENENGIFDILDSGNYSSIINNNFYTKDETNTQITSKGYITKEVDDLSNYYTKSETDDKYLPFTGGTLTGGLTVNGRVNATSFNVQSARSKKENISEFTNSALDLINSIDVVKFNFKEDESKELKIGFIADDTDAILAGENHDKMDLYNCVGVLFKAVQELSKENKELKELLNRG